MKYSKVAKAGAVTAFGGLASLPGFMYALAVKPLQDAQNNLTTSAAKQVAVAQNSNTASNVILGVGAFLLLLLVAYIVIGLYFGARNAEDLKGK
jgi:beta-lactamase regulating signal transducer with metallopeptidase domain